MIKLNVKVIFLGILFLGISQISLSQERKIDLENRFLTPKDSAFYKLPAYVDLTFSVKNLGPDTMFVNDSIRYKLELGEYNKPLVYYKLMNDLLPNDSIIISDSIWFKYPGNLVYRNVRLDWHFSPPYPVRKSSNNGAFPIDASYDQLHFDNNKDTVILTYQPETSSVEGLAPESSYLFPNPNSTGVLQYSLSSDNISKIKIFDVQGKLVKDQDPNAAGINIYELPQGIFSVIFMLDNGSTIIEKFIKQ